MKALLYTHAFIWFNTNSPRLSTAAYAFIGDPANTVFISPASYWEIAIKISAGKFVQLDSYEAFWQSGIDGYGFQILPIELRHTSQLLALPFHHKDPFDRLLIAQALAEGLPLVSGDPTIDAYGVQRVW